jgi:hypothetical protein
MGLTFDANKTLFDQLNSKTRLEMKPSTNQEKGLCLVAQSDVQTAEDIFPKELLLCVADTDHFDVTCDNYFLWLGSTINGQGQIYTAWRQPAFF